MPLPSSLITMGSLDIGEGSVIQTLSASASHALSTSSLSAASVERYVSPRSAVSLVSTEKYADFVTAAPTRVDLQGDEMAVRVLGEWNGVRLYSDIVR